MIEKIDEINKLIDDSFLQAIRFYISDDMETYIGETFETNIILVGCWIEDAQPDDT